MIPIPQTPLLPTAVNSLILKVSAAGMGVLSGILLARLLGPSEFGKYAIAMAAVSLLATVAAMGLPLLVTRESAIYVVHEQWTELKALLITSHRWVLMFSVTLIVIGIALTFIDVGIISIGSLFWYASLCLIPLLAVSQLHAAFLRGLGWIIKADLPNLILRPIVFLLALIAIYFLALPINGGHALVVQVGATTVALVAGILLLSARLPSKVRSATLERKPHWLHGSWIFLAITLANMLEAHIPLYLLGYLTDTQTAGLYQASTQIVSVVAIGLVSINLPLQPKLAALHAKGEFDSAQRAVTEAARLGSILAILAAIAIIPFSELLMSLYGDAYREAAGVLRLLVVAQLINALSGACGVVLAMTGHQRPILRGIAAALCCNYIVCWLAIPRLGLMGAALGLAVSLTVWNAYFVYFAWKKLGLVTVLR